MPKRSLAVLVALLALFAVAAPARAASKPNLFILWMDGRSLADWSAPDLPHFHLLLRDAAIGVLSTRTERESTDRLVLRANAAATFGAGAEGGVDPRTLKPAAISGVHYGLLGDALARAGYHAAIDGERAGSETRLALQNSAGDLDIPIFPGIPSTFSNGIGRHLVPMNEVTLFDLGTEGTMTLADHALAGLRSQMQPADVLVVVSAAPSVDRLRRGIRLGAVAILGPGFSSGLLTSGTTRRDGVVTLTDLAPTIASALGLGPLAGAQGRVATVKYRSNAAPGLVSFERDIVRAALQRHPLTRGALIAGMVLVVLALALVFRGARAQSATSNIVALLLVAVAATPLALYVVGAFHPPTAAVAGAEVAALCLILAVGLRVRLDVPTCMAVVMVLTAIVPLVDLLAGTPLAARSSVEFQIAGGGRFYGVGDEGLGIIVAAEIFAVALLFDRARNPRRAGAIIALIFAATVWLIGAPSFGSKFGAALTAVPAFGVLAVVIGGRRFTRRSIAAIAIATVAVTGLLIGVDAARKADTQSHVARAVEGRSNVAAIVRDKVHAQWQITSHTIWTPAVVLFALAVLFAMRRRREAFARATEWHPMLSPALLAAAVGGVAGFLFNDGGILTAAPFGLFAAATTYAVLLSPRGG